MIVIFLTFLFTKVHCQNETVFENTTDIVRPSCEASCTFEPSVLTPTNLKQWPKNCSTVCASLYIGTDTKLSESQLTAAFKQMKTLIGSLAIIRSTFTSARFLAVLESVECDNNVFMVVFNPRMRELGMTNLSSISCRVYIGSNENMTRLNVPRLQTLIPLGRNNTYMDLDIQSLSPDFCIDIQEMGNFLENMEVRLDYIPGKYCEIQESNSTDIEKICSADNENGTLSLSELQSGCVLIKGDVRVDGGEEEHVEKLETVRSIFGSLIIEGTNLTNIDFLDGLEYVAALEEDKPAIQIHYNPQLSNVSFPSLKRVRSDTRFSVVFLNNSEKLLTSPTTCYTIRESLNTEYTYSPTFDGENCEWIELNAKIKEKNYSSKILDLVFIIVMSLIYL